MEVLLINPPWTMRKGNVWKGIASCVPPIGLAQLASYLEKKNVQIKILDANAESIYFPEIYNRLKKTKPDPVFIGITATTSIIDKALEVACLCKDVFPNTKIILGGVHPSILPEEVLNNKSVDYVIRGEGEETLWELISGKEKAEILGLSYKNNGNIRHNPERPIIENLDELPLPAYHLLPIEKYHPALGSYKQLPGIGIISTRGCPGRCTFCLGQYLGKRIRMNSAKRIIEQIKLLQKEYGIKEISFYDDTFTVFKNNVIEFCELLIKERINITWSCFSRVDFVDKDILLLMKRAGCHQMCYGVESRSEQILQNIKKNISFEKTKNAIELTKDVGIETRATFMLGSPGETKLTMIQTINYAIELEPDIAVFNITTPYPGTEMYAWALDKGYLKTRNWSNYDLSQPVMDLPTLNSEDVTKYYQKAYLKFYGRWGYLFRKFLNIKNLTNLKSSFKAFQTICSILLNR